MTPSNQSPEPIAVPSGHSSRLGEASGAAWVGAKADGAVSSAVPPSFYFGATGAVHVISWRWLSFFR